MSQLDIENQEDPTQVVINTYEVGQIFQESYDVGAAIFCDSSNGRYIIQEIENSEDGKRQFQIVERVVPVEELEENMRKIRNYYLQSYVDPIVCNPFRWDALKNSEQNDYKDYREYLLAYPQSGDDWYKTEPMSFDAWKES